MAAVDLKAKFCYPNMKYEGLSFNLFLSQNNIKIKTLV